MEGGLQAVNICFVILPKWRTDQYDPPQIQVIFRNTFHFCIFHLPEATRTAYIVHQVSKILPLCIGKGLD